LSYLSKIFGFVSQHHKSKGLEEFQKKKQKKRLITDGSFADIEALRG